MNSYRCSDGDRIDQIVFNHYGTLEPLNEVLKANLHLTNKSMILKAGDVIQLPEHISKDVFSSSSVVDESDEEVLLW